MNFSIATLPELFGHSASSRVKELKRLADETHSKATDKLFYSVKECIVDGNTKFTPVLTFSNGKFDSNQLMHSPKFDTFEDALNAA